LARRLDEYVNNIELETRKAFDEFVVDNRRVASAVAACDEFIARLDRAKLDHALDRDELRSALGRVLHYVETLQERLKGSDAPTDGSEDAEE